MRLSRRSGLLFLAGCGRLETSSRLDFSGGCADGLCADERSSGDGTHCDGFGGLDAFFDVTGQDIPGDAVARFFSVEIPDNGTNPDGLGVGLPVSCFVDVLGTPRDTIDVDGESVMATWDDGAPRLLLRSAPASSLARPSGGRARLRRALSAGHLPEEQDEGL